MLGQQKNTFATMHSVEVRSSPVHASATVLKRNFVRNANEIARFQDITPPPTVMSWNGVDVFG